METTYNLAEREAHWRKYWEEKQIYRFHENSSRPIFSIDTPPPYISADFMHAGHIYGYAIAEFVARYKRMCGYEVFYPMGFDDNGFPTEKFVEKKYKIDKNKITRPEFVKLCLEETKRGGAMFRDMWERVGISVDWTKVYSTISPLSQQISQKNFLELYKKGEVVRREDPFYWCTDCQTSVAIADLEEMEEDVPLNYINFIGADGQKLLVATTRPELLPACVALFVNSSDTRYKKLIGTKVRVPIFDYQVPVLADDEVDPEFGTGLMMVCTWGDQDDVMRWRTHKLETRIVFDKYGKMNAQAGEYTGMKLVAARKKIIEDLRASGILEKQEITHRIVKVHERCNTKIEFVVSKQWFVRLIDKKEILLKRGAELNWHPKRMQRAYDDWVSSIKWDWCISRDRYYGIPIPVWYCETCEHVIVPEESALPVDPTTAKAPVEVCPECKGITIRPETNVMDTWMTSSVSPRIIQALVANEAIKRKLYPCTLRPQGSEIIRTWLFYSVVQAEMYSQSVPFKDVMINGMAVDSNGIKLSKRLNNFVPGNKLLEQYGADPIRYWATGATLGETIRINEDEIKKGKRTVTKIFNAAKFASLHLTDNIKNPAELAPEDQWILAKTNETIEKVTKSFEQYEYFPARQAVDNLFWHDFTDNYIEFVKHRLYDKENPTRDAARWTLKTVLKNILKLYAPILPFITEEIYQELYASEDSAVSLHLTSWPEPFSTVTAPVAFEAVLGAVEEIRKFKADKKLSPAAEVAEYHLSQKVENIFLPFLQKVFHIREITDGK